MRAGSSGTLVLRRDYTMMTSKFSDVNNKIAVVFSYFYFFCKFVKMALVILTNRWRWHDDVIDSVLMQRLN